MRWMRLVLVVLLLSGAFAWGFLCYRNRIFPWDVLQGLVGEKHKDRMEIDARSPAFDPLRALPYVDGTFDPDHTSRGVIVNDGARSFPGLNLYATRTSGSARLVDMEGALVHEWKRPGGAWMEVHLFGNGDLLVTEKDRRLFKVDARSTLLWEVRGRFHHDFWVTKEGDIYALARHAERIPEIHPDIPVVVDEIQVRGPDGELHRTLSLLDMVRRSRYAFLLPEVSGIRRKRLRNGRMVNELDILHANHVEVFDGSLAGLSPLFAKGNLLLSLRSLNAILIADGRSLEILWLWGPTNLTAQHDPRLIENGHILVFDNGVRASRVLEIDPLSNRVTWRYAPGENFFSRRRGSVQRLPNGNTLITESDRGYVHEVTPEGEVVWRFANPEFGEGGIRLVIWRMTRIPRENLPFLGPGGRGPGK